MTTNDEKELDEILLSVKDYHDDDDYRTCKSRYGKCSKCGVESYMGDSNCSHGIKWYEEQQCDCGMWDSLTQATQQLLAWRDREVVKARIDELEHTFVSYDNALASELVENPEWEYGQVVERIAELEATLKQYGEKGT